MVDFGSLNGDILSFYQVVAPVLFFSLTIVAYALIVGLSYKTMSKRDIFKLKSIREAKEEHKKNPIISFLISLFEYGIVFPIIIIIWFSILSVLLFLLSKELSAEILITIAVALAASTRIVSYFNEEIAVDIAKLFPLILLGAFLLEPNFFSMDLFYTKIDAVPALLPKLIHFIAVPVIIEWVLRVLLVVKEAISPRP